MARLRNLALKHGLDALVVVAAATSAMGTAMREDRFRPDGLLLAAEAVTIALVVSLLLTRRRFPFAAPASLWVASSALSFLDGRLVASQAGVFVAGMGAAVLLGGVRERTQRLTGLAVVVAGSLVVVHNDPLGDVDNYLAIPLLFVMGWLVGFALRERTRETQAAEERASRAEHERETAARVAVAEERARIARELHDVVAHAVSVMVLQTGAVRHRMPTDEAEAQEALRNVEHAGRTALAEMRRLLGAMRTDDPRSDLLPHVGLDNLGALVTDVLGAGLEVEVNLTGDACPLPPGLDLSAYRIVQEGLTNALKHSRAGHAVVTLDYRPAALLVQVRDDGQGPATDNGTGHGLVGIGERVKIYGGDMYAGPTPEGGFLLRATLPFDRGQAGVQTWDPP